jgi:hypothetical protein
MKKKSAIKKEEQLGMSYGKANNILIRNIIWNFVVKSNMNFCYHCSGELNRENFSIEHIEPWLDSENPLELFFDIKNISFSHHSCNVGNSRKYNKYENRLDAKQARLDSAKKWKKNNRVYDSEKRKEKYKRLGS